MTDTYYIDLSKITLDDLCQELQTRTLLPSRIGLQEKIEERLGALQEQGIDTAAGLLDALKTGKKMQAVADASGVPLEYLKTLRREVGGYKPTPRKFDQIPGIDADTCDKLAKVGIKHSKHFFERSQTPAQREALAEETGLSAEAVLELTKLSDIARIWGVGPMFARVMYETGVNTVAQVAEQDAEAYFNVLKQSYEEVYQTKVDFILRDIKDAITRAKDLPKSIQY